MAAYAWRKRDVLNDPIRKLDGFGRALACRTLFVCHKNSTAENRVQRRASTAKFPMIVVWREDEIVVQGSVS